MFNNAKLLVGLGVCLASSVSDAATVAWDQARDNSVNVGSDIIGDGTVVFAYNGGPADATPFTVGGVDFVSGVISTMVTGHQGAVGDFLGGTSTGDANYDRLLTSVAYGASGDITVENLIIDTQYSVQFFYNDQRLRDRNLLFHDGDPGNVASASAAGANNFGQSVLGLFTADANSQLFNVSGDWGAADFTAMIVREAVFIEYIDGDVDGDRDVDLDDYYAMRDNFNKSVDVVRGDGDVNRDFVVDLEDYAIIEKEYANHNGGASLASAIPEPASLLMMSLGGLVLLKRSK